MPLVVLNLGGEMIFILCERLASQGVDPIQAQQSASYPATSATKPIQLISYPGLLTITGLSRLGLVSFLVCGGSFPFPVTNS